FGSQSSFKRVPVLDAACVENSQSKPRLLPETEGPESEEVEAGAHRIELFVGEETDLRRIPSQLRSQPEIIDQLQQWTIRRQDAVIELVPPEFAEVEVGGQTTKLRTPFNHRHIRACTQQIEGGRQSCDSAA